MDQRFTLGLEKLELVIGRFGIGFYLFWNDGFGFYPGFQVLVKARFGFNHRIWVLVGFLICDRKVYILEEQISFSNFLEKIYKSFKKNYLTRLLGNVCWIVRIIRVFQKLSWDNISLSLPIIEELEQSQRCQLQPWGLILDL